MIKNLVELPLDSQEYLLDDDDITSPKSRSRLTGVCLGLLMLWCSCLLQSRLCYCFNTTTACSSISLPLLPLVLYSRHEIGRPPHYNISSCTRYRLPFPVPFRNVDHLLLALCGSWNFIGWCFCHLHGEGVVPIDAVVESSGAASLSASPELSLERSSELLLTVEVEAGSLPVSQGLKSGSESPTSSSEET